jgi:hypothetical protein
MKEEKFYFNTNFNISISTPKSWVRLGHVLSKYSVEDSEKRFQNLPGKFLKKKHQG